MGVYDIKQVIIIRGDLDYKSKGKMCAMVAHASMAVLLNRMKKKNNNLYECDFTEDIEAWINGSFAKIVLKCKDLEEMFDIKAKAEGLGLPNAIITDSGVTCFNNEQTIVSLAIGPSQSVVIDGIAGHLKLV